MMMKLIIWIIAIAADSPRILIISHPGLLTRLINRELMVALLCYLLSVADRVKIGVEVSIIDS